MGKGPNLLSNLEIAQVLDSCIMRDFLGFWIAFKYGVISLENPQKQ